jgi:hypothetical protein
MGSQNNQFLNQGNYNFNVPSNQHNYSTNNVQGIPNPTVVQTNTFNRPDQNENVGLTQHPNSIPYQVSTYPSSNPMNFNNT